MKVSLDKFDNSHYYRGAGLGKRVIWYFVNAMVFSSWLMPFSNVKVFLLRCFGAKVGCGAVIKPRVNIKYPWRLTMGDHCWIGEGVWIENLADILLEDHVCVSQDAYLLTGNHNFKVPAFDLITRGITLKEGSWVGARSVVCPGVTLEAFSILTVGSIATSTTEPAGIYQGNPAKWVKKREISSS